MAPRGAAKTREYDYSNVGKAGRRTGITLKEGKRDEHGMEEIDGMFSSPEKSPANENGFNNGNETIMGSDGMSMDEGNAPGPADFLNGRRASYFPPPVARSPMKTGLTGSPRRTPGLRSSASPQRDHPSSSPSDGKSLLNAKQRDVSPLSHRSINAPPSNHANSLWIKNKANIRTSEPAATDDFSDSDANSQFIGDENGDSFEQTRDDFVDSFAAGDDTLLEDEAPQAIEEPDQEVTDPDSPDMPFEPRRTEQPRSTTTKAKRAASGNNSRIQTTTQQNGTHERELASRPKRPGRPPKTQRKANEEAEDHRPSKKARTSADRTTGAVKTTGNPQIDHITDTYAKRQTGPTKGRSLYILKHEAPAEDTAARTRSGRVSIKPLAFWKNEKCVFGDGEVAEGGRFPHATVKEVIRTEEIEPEYKKAKSGKRRSKKSKNKDIESDDENEDHADRWEKDNGVLHGYIRKWDPEAQAGIDEEEVLDIAYAPSGIETRDVKDATFRFAKLLSSPFLGSGIVELPPGGVKKPKNSKKMHMVFYVCHGRVQVDISGVQFSVGKGSVFQVPRGNYYSFANIYGFDARLFFTQGCVPAENESLASESASKPTAMEGDSTTDAGRPTKGRPKGSKGGPKGSKGAKQKGGSKAS
ncbi:Cupin domain protein [Aspergillus glaucus CBS 516.65]|uniref:CENP-C homolog n=1 Tax=Aspergillus glaucus CBS 516.65 TaxID=1160497 RepID=A0A1L9VZX5_ASPGL|nr:hypothetical protein ASPGLDRAFT_161836 [Aspergillus glaucus CBS 516.65]OJJ89466.1 hypothetical protein ASPGLDRAFT_161836 [Aspergillus glaucus CBS 516.65]